MSRFYHSDFFSGLHVCIMGIVVGSVLIFAAFFFLRCLSRYIRVLCLRFAVVSYPPEGATYEDGDVRTLCTVCITEYSAGNEVVVLRCGHVFHPGCIRDVVRAHPRCPLCRAWLL